MIDPVGTRLLLYNFILFVLGFLALPWVLYQLVFVKKRRKGLKQRLGRPPASRGRTVWCHAVSVGEVRAMAPMLSLLQDDGRAKDRIVLSTVTDTGQETARRECGFASSIIYFPLDLPFAVSSALNRVNPDIFITAETEIWPNFFAACFRRTVPVVVVNGRISDTSYPRYLKFRWFFRPFLEQVRLFLMQSDEDARRILELGAVPESVEVTGNMKYDRMPEPVSLPDRVTRWARTGFLVVAGSTHRGEEDAVLDAVGGIAGEKNVLTALVPRHPERFEEVAEILKRREVPFTRYTDIRAGSGIRGSVVLVDAMGVLDGFYAIADAAFVGGSLVPVGGHNLLEPAMHGVPVLTGDHLHNFREISESLAGAGGCRVVTGPEELTREISRLAGQEETRRKMGEAARVVWDSTRGASDVNARNVVALI